MEVYTSTCIYRRSKGRITTIIVYITIYLLRPQLFRVCFLINLDSSPTIYIIQNVSLPVNASLSCDPKVIYNIEMQKIGYTWNHATFRRILLSCDDTVAVMHGLHADECSKSSDVAHELLHSVEVTACVAVLPVSYCHGLIMII